MLARLLVNSFASQRRLNSDPKGPDSSFEGRVAIVRLGDAALLREWTLADRGMQVAINEDGSLIAFATGFGGGGAGFGGGAAGNPEVQVWNVTEDRMLGKLASAPGGVSGLVFHSDDLLIGEDIAFLSSTSTGTIEARTCLSAVGPARIGRMRVFSPPWPTVLWVAPPCSRRFRRLFSPVGEIALIRILAGSRPPCQLSGVPREKH